MGKPRAIVLLSGGLDSVVAAHLVREQAEPVLALTADYGQKAARRELAAAYAVAQQLSIPHRTIFLPFLREAATGALVDPHAHVPEPSLSDLDDGSGAAHASAAAVWVPNRNGALIAMAATWAEANDIQHVVCGFNREEAATFPDNSEAFLEATNRALALSTRNGVSVLAPTMHLDKAGIVRAAQQVGAPLDLCWSCYLGEDEPCGRCESCLRFRRALDDAGVAHESGRIQLPISAEKP